MLFVLNVTSRNVVLDERLFAKLLMTTAHMICTHHTSKFHNVLFQTARCGSIVSMTARLDILPFRSPIRSFAQIHSAHAFHLKIVSVSYIILWHCLVSYVLLNLHKFLIQPICLIITRLSFLKIYCTAHFIIFSGSIFNFFF